MRLVTMLHWDLVQIARGEAAHVAFAVAALASAGLVGLGIVILRIWSPFTLVPTFVGRAEPSGTTLSSILGQYRGGFAFLIVMLWLLLLATAVGPAFTAAAIVRDRRAGRLDRVLLDTGRADLVVLGKLFSGLLPLLLVLLVAAPAISFAWMIGGIAKFDAIAEAVTLVLLVVLVAAIGVFASALARTETVAILASYCAVGAVFWAPLLGAVLLTASGREGLASVVASLNPIFALLAGQPELTRNLVHLAPTNVATPPIVWTLHHPISLTAPVWAVDAAFYAVLAAGLVWLSSVALEPLHPLKTRWRRRATARVR